MSAMASSYARALANSLTPAQRSARARKAATARWAKARGELPPDNPLDLLDRLVASIHGLPGSPIHSTRLASIRQWLDHSTTE